MTDARRTTLSIQGMSCQHCVQRVNDTLKGLTGVIRADIDLDAGEASVTHTEAVSRQQLADAVAGAGYDVPAEA